jgi:RHS repeat-associated protein
VKVFNTPIPYKYKFQGQERQDELGLNWDSYKYRNYDYAIGRFFNIDPLSEDYAYQSTYAFAENKVISHRELEGLEGVWFQAVMNADKAANPNGVSAHVMGITQGLFNSGKNLINAIAHPVETTKGLVNMAVAGAMNNNPVGMLAADNAIGTNSFGTSNAVGKSIDKGVSSLVSGNGTQRGEVIGEVAGAVIGAKGLGAIKGFSKGAVAGEVASEVSASTPVGRLGAEMTVKAGTNSPAVIDGINYSGHALDQMQGRGLVPSVVKDAITNPLRTVPGNMANTTVSYGNGVKVITNEAQKVITAMPKSN